MKNITSIFVVLALLPFANANAQTNDFDTWLAHFKTYAAGKGITEQTLSVAFNNVTPNERVIELDRKQPERTKMAFSTYLKNVVSGSRVDNGRRHFADNKTALLNTQSQYGVPASIIVSLWGVETSYGANTGGFDIVRSLATLAWEGRRKQFFEKELLNALFILQGDHISRSDFKGSWAGAMGQNQFMPTSWAKFAVDANGDGHKNIWTDKRDVFASTANYLASEGWDKSLKWGWAVKMPKGYKPIHIQKSVTQWLKEGVKFINSMPNIESHTILTLVIPDGGDGRAYLVSKNYEVIKKWNRSTSFALSVGILSDLIVAKSSNSIENHLNP